MTHVYLNALVGLGIVPGRMLGFAVDLYVVVETLAEEIEAVETVLHQYFESMWVSRDLTDAVRVALPGIHSKEGRQFCRSALREGGSLV